MEDVLDEVDPDDPEINRMLDKIDPTDEDEEVDLEGLDMALEAFIEGVEEKVHRSVSDYHVDRMGKHADKLSDLADKKEKGEDVSFKDAKDEYAKTKYHDKRANSSVGSSFKVKE
jgi:hypothetical protein